MSTLDGHAVRSRRGVPARALDRTVRRTRPTEAAVHDAVLKYLVEVGYGEMRVDEIARRCGLSKATLYRRWTTKARLVVEAYEQCAGEGLGVVDVPDDLRESLVRYCARLFGATGVRRVEVCRALHTASLRDAELASLLAPLVVGGDISSADELRRIIDRACETGQIAATTDADLMHETIVGMLLIRQHLNPKPIDASTIERLVDQLLLPALGVAC